jgi:predicted O-methyltransferase YrrM
MEQIYKYIEDHASTPNEALEWVVKQTHIRTNHARMLSGAIQGQLLRMLVQMTGATRILELGTFTGYSAICLASALPESGHLDTLELNDELEDLILGGFERAGVADKVNLLIGDCKQTLLHLRAEMGLPAGTAQDSDGNNAGDKTDYEKLYDIVYIDANKREYCEYYELVFDMIRPGGLILADNVIWDGKVCQDPLPQDKQTQSIVRFNDMVSADPRVESVIIPLRDGLNVIRKK